MRKIERICLVPTFFYYRKPKRKKKILKSDKNKGLFGSYFFKLCLRIVFENTKNTILMFSENCSYYLNLISSVFIVFFITKKKKKGKQTCFFCFPYF